jgi:D-alanyl-D-alanine carboxypeptidase/D-alanyl-D-alanine-endopeptidase (penicillin-binding protein 4)
MNRAVAGLVVALFLSAAPARGSAPVVKGSAAEPSQARLASRETLRRSIDQILEDSALGRARVSIQVVSLDDGSVVYGRDSDELLNPASNVKLFTTAAALVRLGPEYRFDTEILVDEQSGQKPRKGQPSGPGQIQGNLYVRGKGDPSITTERLWGIANELYFAGLRSVSGNLVLDESYFDGEHVGPGFEQENSDRSYMAPAGALSLNSNAIGVFVSPGDGVGKPAVVELDPPSNYFVVDNQATTTRAHSLGRLFVTSTVDGDHQRIIVSGRVPMGSAPSASWRKIDQPALFLGNTLESYLELRGISVKGKVVLGSVPATAKPFMVHRSDTLDLVLKRVNKNSSNFMAEQLVKTLGAQVEGAPGSWAKGITAIEDFLSGEVGIGLGTFVMKNGSGLNDTNRFSSAQVCKLLRYMWDRFPLAPEYLSSLGIAARDGTLHFRMDGTDAAGRLRGKTGTLENVSALSGYVQSLDGERFAFSVLANDFPTRNAQIVAGIDLVGVAIAGTGSEGAKMARAGGEASELGPLADLKARMAIYEQLASMHDPRNVTLLRTAMRTERDPALRAVVAEAVYRSDPNDSSGARALVEHYDCNAEVFGRLRQIARDFASSTPVLGSLTMIAAQGDLEALGRLVEIAAFARGDEGLLAELREPLADVARNAPDELVTALLAAREGTRLDALGALAKSLASAEESDSPFPEALKRSSASSDPQKAALARQIEQELAARIEAERAPRALPPAGHDGAAPSAAKPGAGGAAESTHGG